MIVIDCDQGTPEWLAARLGCVTASRCKDACDKLKSGAPSGKAIGYAAQVAMERVAGVQCDDTYVNFAMRRGTELEPLARSAYEAATGNWVQQAGIVKTDDHRHGYSTDGFIGDDGALEIKCPLSPLVVVKMWRDADLSDYVHQIQMGLWITGRHWLDFVMFDPRLAPVGKELFIKRVLRDEDFIGRMEDDLMTFMRMVDENEAALRRPLETAPASTLAGADCTARLVARMRAARTRPEADLILDAAATVLTLEQSADLAALADKAFPRG